MNNIWIICKKEVDDFGRDRFLLILFGFLAFIMVASVVISAADFRSKIADYNHYVVALKAAGAVTLPQPQLFALQLMRGSVEYLELVGALFAIIIGYGMIAKEKYRGTLQLLFSRPLGRFSVGGGKLLALGLLWLGSLVAVFIILTGALFFIGTAPLHAVDIGRLAITAGLAWVYLMFWSSLAMGLAAVSRNVSAALVVSIALWLVFVLILPQVGDTMDPDNQVPGGLFKSLQVDKAHEAAVIAHFTGYETARNYIEVSSITKQFERPAFAILGTNVSYNQKSIGYVALHLWPNALSLLIGGAAAMIFALRMSSKQRLLRKE